MPKTRAEIQRQYRERKKRINRNAHGLLPFTGEKPKRPALRWHGGKWKKANEIIAQFPPHQCYVEPYGGAASVLLRKQPAPHEVYNDLDGEIVNFFHVLRENTDDLIRAISLTPYSRQEFEAAWDPCTDPVERARRLWIRCTMSYSAPTACSASATGWRFQRTEASGVSAVIQHRNNAHLRDVADRFLSLMIECDDALKVIERYDAPTTLFYVDPPYVHSTRSKWAGKAYAHEMTDEDHIDLLGALKAAEGHVVLSGYNSALYRAALQGWEQIQMEARDITGKKQVETLWIKPETYAATRLPLFD